MKYRRLVGGDYTFGGGLNDFLSDVDAVGQAVATRLKLLLGEWWEDTSDGLPLWEGIMSSSGSQGHRQYIDALIRDRILSTPHVDSIDQMESLWDADGRGLQFAAKITTDYGTVVVTNAA